MGFLFGRRHSIESSSHEPVPLDQYVRRLLFMTSTPNSIFRLRKHADYQRVYKASRKQFAKQMSYFFSVRPQLGPDGTPLRDVGCYQPASWPHGRQGDGKGRRSQSHQAAHARGCAQQSLGARVPGRCDSSSAAQRHRSRLSNSGARGRHCVPCHPEGCGQDSTALPTETTQTNGRKVHRFTLEPR